MAQHSTEQLMIGTLMHAPKLLLQTDKYQIVANDFENPVYRYVFWAIDNLAPGAAKELTPYEIEQWMFKSPSAKAVYENKNGRQALIDCEGVPVSSFDGLYSSFKKENLVKDLHSFGYDTSRVYVETPITETDRKIDEVFANSTTQDILDKIGSDFIQLQSKYTLNDTSEVQTLFSGMEEMLEELAECPEIGLPLQGKLFNHILNGAIAGRFYLRSGSSGLGKTRTQMADACHLAFPVRYNWDFHRWEQVGFCEKVMIIITEQNFDEVRKMALAYLTGINESVIKKNLCTPEQKEVLRQALGIFKRYEDNFRVVRVPSPSISLVKQLVREQVSLHDIRYVFYDYIFISPSLLGEFRGMALRNDEILLMFSDALKQLAVELDIFIMSSTQVNANADNSNDIRNEASIAGSRAVINKADVGCIMARPTKDELKTLEPITDEMGMVPNVVTDIYKLRGGENTQTRVWSVMDLGTLRKVDLFVTDARLEQVDIGYEKVNYAMAETLMNETALLLAELNKKGERK